MLKILYLLVVYIDKSWVALKKNTLMALYSKESLGFDVCESNNKIKSLTKTIK